MDLYRLLHRFGRETGYAASAFVIALITFVLVLVPLIVGLSIFWLVLGLPVLAGTVLVARATAYLERDRLSRLTGEPALAPTYRKAPADATLLTRVTTPLKDPQSWLDVAWGLFGWITATLATTLVLTWWASALGGLTYGYWQRFVDRGSDPHTLASLMGFGTSVRADVTVITLLGAIALLTLVPVTRFAAGLHSSTARALLCTRARWSADPQPAPRLTDGDRDLPVDSGLVAMDSDL